MRYVCDDDGDGWVRVTMVDGRATSRNAQHGKVRAIRLQGLKGHKYGLGWAGQGAIGCGMGQLVKYKL